MNKPSCFIDVDLTLVDIELTPYEGVRERLIELSKKYELVCWSAGGKEYATQVLNQTRLRQYFSTVLDKPYIIVDDEPDSILTRARVLRITLQENWTKESFWSRVFNKPIGELCSTRKKLTDI